MTYSLKFIVALVSLVISTGCHSTPLKNATENGALFPSAEGKVSQQIIVKFKPSSVACNAQAVSGFGNEVQVHLAFLRLMSGNACVMTHHSSDASSLQQEQMKLKRHPAIEWIEADEPVQIHQ